MKEFTKFQKSPKLLRKAVLNYRKSLSPEIFKTKFDQIRKNLQNFPVYQNSSTVLCYYGKISSGEFDTTPLLHEIIKDEFKTLLLPKSIETTRTLDLYYVQNIQTEIEEGLYKIMEPNPNLCQKENIEEIDLVIVPGSVFDQHGARYGYGAGYYDGMLSKFNGIKIALALDVCVMPFSLKLHSRDIKMDYIITETSIFPQA